MKTLLVQSSFGLVAIVLYSLIPDFFESIKYLLFGLVLLVIGIPHGAMDHVIDGAINDWKPTTFNLKFYAKYLGMMVGYLVVWYFLPLVAIVVFFGITAYHFGQADAQRYSIDRSWVEQFVIISRGLTIIVLLLYADLPYASAIIETMTDFDLYSWSTSYLSVDVILPSTAIVSTLVIVTALLLNGSTFKLVATAIMENLIIVLLFTQVNIVIAFSLYFGWWHSYEHVKVMAAFLFDKGENLTFISFYKQSFTFSMIAYLGLLFVYNILDAFEETELMVGLLLILISILTLPHLFVVESLYKKS